MAFVAAGTYDQQLANVTLTPSLTNATAGSVNILFTQHNNSGVQAGAKYFFPSNYAPMFNATSLSHRGFLHIAPCSGTESSADTISITTSGGTSGIRHFAIVFNFSNTSTLWESSGVSVGTSRLVPDSAVTTLGPGRLAVNIIGVGQSSGSSDFVGETGGTWALNYNMTGTALPPVVSLYTASMATADTIDGGTFTMGTSAIWVGMGFALIDTPSATNPFMLFDSRIFVSPIFGSAQTP